MKQHMSEADLALYSGGDLGFFERFRVSRHLAKCDACRLDVEAYRLIRRELAAQEPEIDGLNWAALSREMTANIHLGLEAGACIATPAVTRRRTPQLIFAAASLCLLAGTGLFLKYERGVMMPSHSGPVLASTTPGLELRAGDNSMVLLQRGGQHANQTVGAQGEIQARYVDSETGSVTINNVYLEQ